MATHTASDAQTCAVNLRVRIAEAIYAIQKAAGL